MILPLQTPLQPQISASSGKAATAAIGSRGRPLIGLAEDQRVAHLGDIGGLLLQIVEPGAVGGFAVTARCRRCGCPSAPGACRRRPWHRAARSPGGRRRRRSRRARRASMPVTLSLVGVSVWTKAGELVAREMRGGDARHLVERRDEAIDHGRRPRAHSPSAEACRIGGLHAVVDDDAAVDGEAGLLGEPAVRADAGGHDDERRGDDPCRRRARRPRPCRRR